MLALLLAGLLLSLPFLFRLDGKTHAPWEQFLGRFHVLAVHVPIGLLLLVPVLEIAGALRPALREAAGFVLALSFAACLGTLTLGFLLAYGGGFHGATVTRHMWGGIVLTTGVLLCLLARPAWSSGAAPGVYSAMLGGVLLTLVWTAHQGGTLTHGNGYLTEYMPASLKRVLTPGMLRAAPASGSFYAEHIDPIFDANCVSCHGASKTEGGLRLDSYNRLMRGGDDGSVILSGQPEKSLLLARISLPAGDKHRMPAEGRPPLRPEEIAWIRAWIAQGASPSAATLDHIKQGSGRMVFAAAGTEQESLESDTLKHGFFTYYLVQALRQQGGSAPLSKIFDYTQQHVAERVGHREGVAGAVLRLAREQPQHQLLDLRGNPVGPRARLDGRLAQRRRQQRRASLVER